MLYCLVAVSLNQLRNIKEKKLLFVAPFNKLTQNIMENTTHNAITYHRLFSLNIHNNECKQIRKMEISPYDVTCFDEIYMYSLHQLSKIKMFMDKHPNKEFIATGDLAQLNPIENEYLFNNIKNIDATTTEAMNAMFPNQITLKIWKRVATDEERNTLTQLKKEIFDKKTKPFDVLTKIFQSCEKYG